MICGFILIVSLLSIAIKKNIPSDQKPTIAKFELANDELLSSITYSADYTIVLFFNSENDQVLRIVSNKTGKIISDTLVSSLIKGDSNN